MNYLCQSVTPFTSKLDQFKVKDFKKSINWEKFIKHWRVSGEQDYGKWPDRQWMKFNTIDAQ